MTERLAKAADLRKLLRCDFETGDLFWLERAPEMFKRGQDYGLWNGRFAGKKAAWVRRIGYKDIRVWGKIYKAHRVIWALYHGEWPSLHIDHIDGDRGNNAIANLRQATRSQNQSNRGAPKSNTSGYKGVYWDRRRQSWRADIMCNGKRKFLGNFVCPLNAHAAYRIAANKIYGEFAKS